MITEWIITTVFFILLDIWKNFEKIKYLEFSSYEYAKMIIWDAILGFVFVFLFFLIAA